MALYGFDIKLISRVKGGSVAKTASYILRSNIYDSYEDKTYYYSYVDDLLHSEILIPESAPPRIPEFGDTFKRNRTIREKI